jgi:hypothetical protein
METRNAFTKAWEAIEQAENLIDGSHEFNDELLQHLEGLGPAPKLTGNGRKGVASSTEGPGRPPKLNGNGHKAVASSTRRKVRQGKRKAGRGKKPAEVLLIRRVC